MADYFSERLNILLEDEEWEKAKDFCSNRISEKPNESQAYIGLLMVEERINKFEDLKKINNLVENKHYKEALKYAEGDYKLDLILLARGDNNKRNDVAISNKDSSPVSSGKRFSIQELILNTIEGWIEAFIGVGYFLLLLVPLIGYWIYDLNGLCIGLLYFISGLICFTISNYIICFVINIRQNIAEINEKLSHIK